MLQPNDKIGLVACSNGMSIASKDKIHKLIIKLQELGLQVECSPYLYAKEGAISGAAREKAQVLMRFYKDDRIKMICDISGGDLANEVLCYLDFEVLKKHPKPFFGYSDLTTILNAIYTKTRQISYLYQVRNLVGDHDKMQQDRFYASLCEGKEDLFQVQYEMVQGSQMSGILVGGNIRCFLKLAGTPLMPELQEKILFLEAMSGKVPQMTTYLYQLKLMGAFEKVRGIVLGTFTQMERENEIPRIEELVKEIVGDPKMPIAKTKEIGHGSDAKALKIGSYFSFSA